MKSKVIDRPLFKKKGPPVPPEEADNVGIMQGFMDQFDELDDMEEEDDDSDISKMMDRRPDSPEILMNNLRGDMRSVDARVEELADLVGYRAASETPTEVLALLQPVLAQQGAMMQPPPQMMGPTPPGPMAAPAGGVADLAAMAQGPQTTPPPMPAPEAAPLSGIGSLPAAAEQQTPIAMKRGGIVQHFQQGSDEEGVTLVDAGGQGAFYPPELVERAQRDLANLMSERPQRSPSLEQAMASRLPLYQGLLGADKEAVQAQMLFDIAQGALNVAGGVDAEGRPIRGAVSPFSRIAAGMRNVPALIGARAGEISKAQREAKLLALQAGEKDIAVIREYNYKLLDSQRKASADIVKAAAKGQGFGSGLKGAAWNFVTRFAPEYGAGKLTPEMDRRFESSYAIVSEPSYYTDPKTETVVRRDPIIPRFISNAFTLRGDLPASPAPSKGGKKGAAPTDRPVSEIPSGTAAVPSTADAVTTDQEPISAPAAPVTKSLKSATLWQLSPFVTGPGPTTKDIISSIPGLGTVGEINTEARTTFQNSINELVKNLQTSPVYAQGERKDIKGDLNLDPRFMDDPAKLRNKLRGVYKYLSGRLRDAEINSNNPNIPVSQQKEYIQFATTIRDFIPKLGIPPEIYTNKELERFHANNPPGTPFYWNGKELRFTIRTQ